MQRHYRVRHDVMAEEEAALLAKLKEDLENAKRQGVPAKKRKPPKWLSSQILLLATVRQLLANLCRLLQIWAVTSCDTLEIDSLLVSCPKSACAHAADLLGLLIKRLDELSEPVLKSSTPGCILGDFRCPSQRGLLAMTERMV